MNRRSRHTAFWAALVSLLILVPLLIMSVRNLEKATAATTEDLNAHRAALEAIIKEYDFDPYQE